MHALYRKLEKFGGLEDAHMHAVHRTAFRHAVIHTGKFSDEANDIPALFSTFRKEISPAVALHTDGFSQRKLQRQLSRTDSA